MSDSDKVLASLNTLSSTLKASKRDVESALKELEQSNIIARTRGEVKILPPPTTWLEKFQKQNRDTVSGPKTGTVPGTARNLRDNFRAGDSAVSVNSPALKGGINRRTPNGPAAKSADAAQISVPDAQIAAQVEYENRRDREPFTTEEIAANRETLEHPDFQGLAPIEKDYVAQGILAMQLATVGRNRAVDTLKGMFLEMQRRKPKNPLCEGV